MRLIWMLLQVLPAPGMAPVPPDPFGPTCDRACMEQAPVRRISGVWINDFEGSIFIEGARRIEDTRRRSAAPWFGIDNRTEVPRGFRRFYGRAYRVTLYGRRSPVAARPGVRGRRAILADRIVSITDVGTTDRDAEAR